MKGWRRRSAELIHITQTNTEMDSKFVVNTLVGAVAFFFLGYLIYELALGDVLSGYMDASAEPVMWALTVSQLGLGALMATVIGAGSARDFASGAKAGFMLGLMYSVAVMFDLLGTQDIFSSTMGAVWATLLESVRFALAGSIVAWWMGRG